MESPTLSGHNKPRQTLLKCDILALDVDRNTTLNIDTSGEDNNCMDSRYSLLHNGKYRLYKEEKQLHNRFGIIQQSLEVDEYKECCRIDSNNRNRKWRQFNKFLQWYYVNEKSNSRKDYNIVFGDLTFRDDVLQKTSKETRRRYVERFLKENSDSYVANIDYGDKEGREHYHFLINVNGFIKKGTWKYGFDFYKKVTNVKSLKIKKNYLLKLNNHSYKDSTKLERIITSRKKSDFIKKFIKDNMKDYTEYKRRLIEA